MTSILLKPVRSFLLSLIQSNWELHFLFMPYIRFKTKTQLHHVKYTAVCLFIRLVRILWEYFLCRVKARLSPSINNSILMTNYALQIFQASNGLVDLVWIATPQWLLLEVRGCRSPNPSINYSCVYNCRWMFVSIYSGSLHCQKGLCLSCPCSLSSSMHSQTSLTEHRGLPSVSFFSLNNVTNGVSVIINNSSKSLPIWHLREFKTHKMSSEAIRLSLASNFLVIVSSLVSIIPIWPFEMCDDEMRTKVS